VHKGPIRTELSDEEYPKDERSRPFTTTEFLKMMKNRTSHGWCTQTLRTVFIVFHADIFNVTNIYCFE
jgi:hypothetical protein